MNRKEIDKLWNKALRDAVEAGEMYTRYHFAALIEAAEREACLTALADPLLSREGIIAAIRARGQK